MTINKMKLKTLTRLSDKGFDTHKKILAIDMRAARNHGLDDDIGGIIDLQDAIKATEGVKDATLSFMTLKVKVEFEEGADPEKVMQAARTNVKKIEDDMEIFL